MAAGLPDAFCVCKAALRIALFQFGRGLFYCQRRVSVSAINAKALAIVAIGGLFPLLSSAQDVLRLENERDGDYIRRRDACYLSMEAFAKCLQSRSAADQAQRAQQSQAVQSTMAPRLSSKPAESAVSCDKWLKSQKAGGSQRASPQKRMLVYMSNMDAGANRNLLKRAEPADSVSWITAYCHAHPEAGGDESGREYIYTLARAPKR
jgi:hypothetical protein